jgi:nicotinate-nucleotide pyrophosphorylase (carboxylating)
MASERHRSFVDARRVSRRPPPREAVARAARRVAADRYEPLVRAALLEDFGSAATSRAMRRFRPERKRAASLVARRPGRARRPRSGAARVYAARPGVAFESFRAVTASASRPAQTIATIAGDARALLGAERTALNLALAHERHRDGDRALRRGVRRRRAARSAKRARRLPGLRALEKYAVRAGGGTNHRLRLDDAILIKDNHIAPPAASRRRSTPRALRAGHLVKVEIEVDSLAQLEEVLAHRGGVDASCSTTSRSIRTWRSGAPGRGALVVEASGGIALETSPRSRDRAST